MPVTTHYVRITKYYFLTINITWILQPGLFWGSVDQLDLSVGRRHGGLVLRHWPPLHLLPQLDDVEAVPLQAGLLLDDDWRAADTGSAEGGDDSLDWSSYILSESTAGLTS